MADLSARLVQFVHGCIPTLQAAELVLFFAAHPDRPFTPEEIVVAMRPVVITVPAVKQYTALLMSCGLLVEGNGAFAYGPASSEVEAIIGELAHAYNERPVTLINVIYGAADKSLRSFADAFKLRKE